MKTKSEKNRFKTVLDKAVDTMSAIFVPVLPVITAAGILKALILLLAALNLLSEDSSTYYVLSFVSDAGFYFLPILLTYSTAKHFGGNPYLAAFFCAFLFHPDFTSVVDQGGSLSLLSLSIPMKSYHSAVIPAVIIGWSESVLEKFFRKHIPDIISFFAVPLLTTLIMAPLILLALGPVGIIAGDALCTFMDFMHNKIGWPAIALLAGLCPLIVSAGASLCFLPLSLAALESLGFDSFTRPSFLAANVAIGAAALAVSLKSKIRNNKSLALQTSIIAYMGVTEPSLYGVLIPLKRPLLTAMAGAAAGGAFAGLTGVKAVAYASPSLITLPVFLSDTFVYAVLTVVVSSAVSFLLTWFFGFEDLPLHGTHNGTGPSDTSDAAEER